MTRVIWTGLSLQVGFLFVPATAADKDVGSLSKRDACIDKAYESEGARQAEELGGRLGVEEFLIETCGFRPVVEANHKISLTSEDCATVYSRSKAGLCNLSDFSSGDSVMVKALDPRVFDLDKFTKRCELNNARQRHEGFLKFRKHVCTANVHHAAVDEQESSPQAFL